MLFFVMSVVLCQHVVQANHRYFIGNDSEQTACSIADCLPFINLREKLHLTNHQKQQVVYRSDYLRSVHRQLTSAGADASRHGRGVVEITPEQRAKILAMYGNYFTTKSDLPAQNSIQKRDVDICPRVQSWDDLILRLTDNNELIQVVQFGNDNGQWILEETCSQSTCSFVPQCACGTWSRLVRALVVNFDETIIEEKYIKVYCCIAKKLST